MEDLLKNIYIASNDINYWFFRPGKGGEFFNSFYDENSIGIAWDNINDKSIIQNKKKLKQNVVAKYGESEKNPGNITNKIFKFCNILKKNDIIVMIGSTEIGIGKLIDDDYEIICDSSKYISSSSSNSNTIPGKVNKIRKIKWIERTKKNKMNAKLLLNISYARHTVSAINKKQTILY